MYITTPMNSPSKTCIFDLFDTLLLKVAFDYNKGIDYLAKNHFGEENKEKLFSIASEFRSQFMLDREKTQIDVSFEDQLKFYENRFNRKLAKKYSDIEWDFFLQCREERIADGAINFLKYLKERGYTLAILSNSIFSSETLKKYLEMHQILHFFDVVISSADIKYRKPSKKAFDTILEKVNIKASPEIYYIGNKLDKDFYGAYNAGLSPILISNNSIENIKPVFSNLNAVQDFFERNFVYINSISEYESLVDGPGLRTVVFFQGCLRHCEKCHNQSTWSLTQGKRYSVRQLAEIIKAKAKNKKITLSGGEPLLQQKAIVSLLNELPDFDICLYTGGYLNDVSEDIKQRIHYLKIGAFDENRKTSTTPYVGSTNQSLIDLRGI
jgi:HAD superfamily hydrolase (TIGR01549 family)